MTPRHFDVVVVGGGLAGLTAANRCAEQGLTVALLEAGSGERYLCNSRIAMGIINIAFRDVAEERTLLRRLIDTVTAGAAEPALADALVENIGPAMRWLKGHGVRTLAAYWGPGAHTMLVPPAALAPGLRWPGRGPDQTLRRLEAAFARRGGTFFRATRARELVMDENRVSGVRAELGIETIDFAATAVVLADGGFQGDAELLRAHVTPRPDRMVMRHAGSGRGDGLRMAQAAGARLTDLRRFYGHVQSVDALTDPLLWPYPTLDLSIAHGLLVGPDGQRFTDEGCGGVAVANAIARRTDPLGTVAIFDRAIWLGPAAELPLPANPLLARSSATMHVSGTLEGLATLARLPPENLRATVTTHNRAVADGQFAQPGPPRTASVYKPMTIATPPYIAVPVVAGITYTMGGIAIDAAGRVQHRDGGLIQGLYAAGSTTGGHEGGPNAGYTGGLSKALTFGWLAGNSIAAEAAVTHREKRSA